MLDDVNVIVDMAIAENPSKPIFLVGHSMSGFAVSLFGAKYPDKRLKGIVTSGAVTRDNQQTVSGVPRTLDPHLQLANELGGGICSVPEVVDWYGKDTYDFFAVAASTDHQMKIYGGLYHEIFNEYCRDEVLEDAIRWIKLRN